MSETLIITEEEKEFLDTLIDSYKGSIGNQMIILIKKFIYDDKSKISKDAKTNLSNIKFNTWSDWKDGVKKGLGSGTILALG